MSDPNLITIECQESPNDDLFVEPAPQDPESKREGFDGLIIGVANRRRSDAFVWVGLDDLRKLHNVIGEHLAANDA